jgi:hypothetical protein
MGFAIDQAIGKLSRAWIGFCEAPQAFYRVAAAVLGSLGGEAIFPVRVAVSIPTLVGEGFGNVWLYVWGVAVQPIRLGFSPFGLSGKGRTRTVAKATRVGRARHLGAPM